VTYRNASLLKLAKGCPCANCNAQDDTVVSAHSNLHEHGRGFAHPSHDCYIAFLCVRCHHWLDHGKGMDPTRIYNDSRQDKAEMFRRAMDKTWRYCWENELIKVAA
jgi:hypothetical protein